MDKTRLLSIVVIIYSLLFLSYYFFFYERPVPTWCWTSGVEEYCTTNKTEFEAFSGVEIVKNQYQEEDDSYKVNSPLVDINLSI